MEFRGLFTGGFCDCCLFVAVVEFVVVVDVVVASEDVGLNLEDDSSSSSRIIFCLTKVSFSSKDNFLSSVEDFRAFLLFLRLIVSEVLPSPAEKVVVSSPELLPRSSVRLLSSSTVELLSLSPLKISTF